METSSLKSLKLMKMEPMTNGMSFVFANASESCNVFNDITSHERMMKDMTETTNLLGGFLPGVYPQFMVGLKLHSTHILE